MRKRGNTLQNRPLRIIGIDPGYAIVGYGVLDYYRNRFQPVNFGAVTTPAGMDFPDRLQVIYDELDALLARFQPQAMSVEKLFFTTNQKTGIDVAQARGVILLCAKKHGVDIFEYTPLQVKSSVTGYGKAEKNQVIQMVKTMLGLAEAPKPDDTADALAVAICHGHSAGSYLSRIKEMIKG